MSNKWTNCSTPYAYNSLQVPSLYNPDQGQLITALKAWLAMWWDLQTYIAVLRLPRNTSPTTTPALRRAHRWLLFWAKPHSTALLCVFWWAERQKGRGVDRLAASPVSAPCDPPDLPNSVSPNIYKVHLNNLLVRLMWSQALKSDRVHLFLCTGSHSR